MAKIQNIDGFKLELNLVYFNSGLLMKKIILTLLLLVSFPLLASHIVGGEFELVHISGTRYRLSLIYYFDVINNTFNGVKPEVSEPTLTAHIYQKSTNTLIRSVALSFASKTRVSYTQPTCSKGEIVTDKLIYSSEIDLSESIFNSPQGYYISWERCCRNYTITNIFSAQPPSSQFAGQTFYLEFPAVVKNGESFVNNSPHLFPPLNDYGCVNKPYYTNFAGTDDDGDSLIYSLVTPLNTFSNAAVPNPPSAGPYNIVQWKSGFSLTNILKGKPDLKISDEGFLTVTPTMQGLFVFAVRCEEFRKGKKIGEVRRDFQMLVIDCPKAEPPVIVGKKSSDAIFPLPSANSLSVSFNNTVTDADRFIEVKVSDKDSFKPTDPDFFKENIKIKVVPLNFKKKSTDTWFAEESTVLTNGADSIKVFKISFPQCPYINGPYQVGIVAYDDACSLPLTDTLRVTVNIEPPPNHRAKFTTPKLTTVQIIEGDQPAPWSFQATDADLDDLVVSVVTDGFALNSFGMAVNFTQQKGLVNGTLSWDPRCNIYDFTKRTAFTIKILVDDKDLCNFGDPDTAVYKLSIRLPGNSDPIIDSDLTLNPAERKVHVERKVYESLSFKVIGKDLVDNDFLILSDKAVGFPASDFPASFPQVSGNGLVSSNFLWNIGCEKLDLKKKDTYTFQFIVVDNANKCRFFKADTLDVEVKVLPPDNFKPELFALSTSQKNISNSSVNYTLGQSIEFTLLGTDSDLLPQKDNLSLSLIGASGNVEPVGFTFQSVSGKPPVQSVFSWNPDCSIFKNQVYENNYEFKFRLVDDRCLNTKGDTIKVSLKIKDIDGTDRKFLMPNVFTPNGDNHNDFFALEGIEGNSGGVSYDDIVSLPKDNCTDHFESVKIFNRWGDLVFESTDRKFRWYAPNSAAGVYFYRVKFANREFRSPLSVRY